MLNKQYVYYSLTKNGKRKDEYISYTDIAYEFGVTKNSIAGKYDRALHYKNSNIINVNGTLIEKVPIVINNNVDDKSKKKIKR